MNILKKDQEVFDTIDDDDDDDDSNEDDDKDDLDDLADDTELSDDPNIDDDDDEDDDDIYDDDIDWDTTPSSTTASYKTSAPTTTPTTTTTTRTTTIATPDPYFTHFDPRNEHESYKEAQVNNIFSYNCIIQPLLGCLKLLYHFLLFQSFFIQACSSPFFSSLLLGIASEIYLLWRNACNKKINFNVIS